MDIRKISNGASKRDQHNLCATEKRAGHSLMEIKKASVSEIEYCENCNLDFFV